MKERFINVARGLEEADLVLKNGNILNFFTNEIIKADIAICEDTIVGVGEYTSKNQIDITGKFVSPAFIDSHLHIESSMSIPSEFIKEVLPWGTTTLITDPHEIANVSGLDGIKYMLDEADKISANIFIMLPSCVPATPFEDSGAILEAEQLIQLRDNKNVLGLAEMMNYVGVVNKDKNVHKKLEVFSNKIIDGHAPMLLGKDLQAYRLSSIVTDHECTNSDEVIEKLRAGMFILAREGSAARNVKEIMQAIIKANMGFDRVAFCTDDKHVEDIRNEGHISYNIKLAISLGVPPIEAYKMASYNSANFYGLKRLGAIGAGYQADLVILDDLENVKINFVYHKGINILNEQNGDEKTNEDIPHKLMNTVNIGEISAEDIQLKVNTNKPAIIQIIPNQIVTKRIYENVKIENEVFLPDENYKKILVIERHNATKTIGKGIVKGFNIHGAIASTVGHDSHNLIVIGDNDEDILLAIKEIEKVQGGYTLVQDKKVLKTLELPICGLMSKKNVTEVQETLKEMTNISRRMGVSKEFDPFITMSFLALPVIPEIRLTNKGLFDVTKFEFI